MIKRSVFICRAAPIEKLDDQARAFGEVLVGPDRVPTPPRVFVDPERFMRLPTRNLGTGQGIEDGADLLLEALDIEALRGMPDIDDQEIEKAKAWFAEALSAADLEPERGEILARRSWFELFNRAGEVVLKKPIGLRLWFEHRIDDIPCEGPGAKITVSFDSEGFVTHYHFAWRRLEQTKKAAIISRSAAQKRCRRLYQKSLPKLERYESDIRLTYYLPPVENRKVEEILPHYLCGGTAELKDGGRLGGGEIVGDGKIMLLETRIPAVKDRAYTPRASLSARIENGEIWAKVRARGGKPPYTFEWQPEPRKPASSADSLKYELGADDQETETVIVRVSDINGISTVVRKILKVPGARDQRGERGKTLESSQERRAEVHRYFGTENVVSESKPDEEVGLVRQLLKYHGSGAGFSASGVDARQRHFMHPEDRDWVDGVNFVFFVGHGFGDGLGFQFKAKHDDEKDWILSHGEVVGQWGDQRLNWLALHSCDVLRALHWSGAFNGLHLLLGFRTLAAFNPAFSGGFALNMLERRMHIAAAWFLAIGDHQPDSRIGAIMGAVRDPDYAVTYNDRYTGIGLAGPDIAADEILYFFRVSGP